MEGQEICLEKWGTSPWQHEKYHCAYCFENGGKIFHGAEKDIQLAEE